VAVDLAGNIVGETIEEQTRATLDNCRRQLATAGCDFEDVFKVTVFLTDMEDWSRFNDVYVAIMPDPKPVRTTIGCVLYPGFLVEIEMWAAKPA
jgi:2-iminobutanoate/2-iminopropanoate deaminase